ncbi:hypothetical protein [Streptomyces sp. ME18-1-4]|uniref:hypothetical protein n=1 Tax=Streptomyces sp. ME18-1-4 TaxID=3028685 RepID=UPI0029BAE9E3|nr:hypothetical protein [Streptomyces sp. ME18-1-4]MDX3243473.1 hypothetical protein [Streptomyces sp. ME18-1-4]
MPHGPLNNGVADNADHRHRTHIRARRPNGCSLDTSDPDLRKQQSDSAPELLR